MEKQKPQRSNNLFRPMSGVRFSRFVDPLSHGPRTGFGRDCPLGIAGWCRIAYRPSWRAFCRRTGHSENRVTSRRFPKIPTSEWGVCPGFRPSQSFINPLSWGRQLAWLGIGPAIRGCRARRVLTSFRPFGWREGAEGESGFRVGGCSR
jgi:hypothetical protein